MIAGLAGLLFSPAGRLLGGAVALCLLAGGVFTAGYVKGRQGGREAVLQRTVDAYAEREGIDDVISRFDRARLCRELGGLPDECDRLRGMEEGEP